MQTVLFTTSGDGYWSKAIRNVRITDMRLGYVSEDKDFGELCVFFNTEDWDVNKVGLIYTDAGFKQDLQAFITEHGLVVDLCYSEQGMQGDDYVSFDVGADFLSSWEAKFGVIENV